MQALVQPGDVVVGISTSGNSQSVLKGIEAAKKLKAWTAALTGQTGGKLKGVRRLLHHGAFPADGAHSGMPYRAHSRDLRLRG